MVNRYLFPEYTRGSVHNLDGSVINSVLLNYDTVSDEMLFVDEVSNEILSIANPASIAYINIDGRQFVFGKKQSFYERIAMDDNYFFIQWHSRVQSKGKAAAYGGYSQTTSVDNISSFQSGTGTQHNLKIDEKFTSIPTNTYFLSINNKLKQFVSQKALLKLMKGHENEVNTFIKDEKINFRKGEDVTKLVAYCYELLK